MNWSKTERLALWALVVLIPLALPLMAQEAPPVDATGTEVATEQTPAAAANSDALRKAAQNPVASLISVPIQNNPSRFS